MTRALFTGDRNWQDTYIVDLIIGGLESLMTFGAEELVIIEGEARGLDRIARTMAEARHRVTKVLQFPANWNKYRRAAGPLRNQQMLDEGKPHMVFAFHNDLPHSSGALDMCERALKVGIPVYHVRRLDEVTVKRLRRYQREAKRVTHTRRGRGSDDRT